MDAYSAVVDYVLAFFVQFETRELSLIVHLGLVLTGLSLNAGVFFVVGQKIEIFFHVDEFFVDVEFLIVAVDSIMFLWLAVVGFQHGIYYIKKTQIDVFKLVKSFHEEFHCG